MDEPVLRVGTLADAEAIAALMTTSAEALFPRFYDARQAASAVRFVASEVPTGLSLYNNPLPGSQVLPASLRLTSQPAFWRTTWGTPPWPAIGPDVTGGDVPGLGGHANNIPAQLCYANSPIDANYPGAADRGVLLFDAARCYVPGSGGLAAPTNLRIIP